MSGSSAVSLLRIYTQKEGKKFNINAVLKELPL